MFNKYLKYKNKYLNLKKQIGGTKIIHLVEDNDRFVMNINKIDDVDLLIITDKIGMTKTTLIMQNNIHMIMLFDNTDYFLINFNKKTGNIIEMTDDFKLIDLKLIKKDIIAGYHFHKNIKFIPLKKFINPSQTDITRAQIKIDELNSELHKKCSQLSLRFGHGYDMTGCTFMYNESDYNLLTLYLYQCY